MVEYKSFNNSIKKLQKIWEQNEINKSKIDNNLSKFSVDFNSVNFNKKIVTVPILDLDIINSAQIGDYISGKIAVIELLDFPEWLLNHINIVPIVDPIGDINTDRVVTEETDGNPGDIFFVSKFSKQWMAKLSGNNYKLKLFLRVLLAQITLNDPIFLPFNFKIELKILNPRIYENINTHKR